MEVKKVVLRVSGRHPDRVVVECGDGIFVGFDVTWTEEEDDLFGVFYHDKGHPCAVARWVWNNDEEKWQFVEVGTISGGEVLTPDVLSVVKK